MEIVKKQKSGKRQDAASARVYFIGNDLCVRTRGVLGDTSRVFNGARLKCAREVVSMIDHVPLGTTEDCQRLACDAIWELYKAENLPLNVYTITRAI